MNEKHNHIESAQEVIAALGLPKAQQNERSALALLALLNLTPERPWSRSEDPLMGITPIMEWIRHHYNREYAPNTRESFRRQTIHQFCNAGIILCNPDQPNRAVNSPKTVYRIESSVLTILRSFGTQTWNDQLTSYLSTRETLMVRYTKERNQYRIPVEIAPGRTIALSPGEHNELILAIIRDFAPRFAPGSIVVYVGDPREKWSYFDSSLLAKLGVTVDPHGKMPDVVLYFVSKIGYSCLNRSQVMARLMASVMQSLQCCFPALPLGLFMLLHSRIGLSWAAILARLPGKPRYGWRMLPPI